MNDLYCWETKFKSCCYSERLLTKLLLLNETAKQKIDILKIKKAIYYARKYHGSQKRQSGEAYYSHPLDVAYMVADHRLTTDVLVTCILHDTIEDTVLTKEMITTIFDSRIANQVEDLTRIKKDRKISSAEMVELLWQQKKGELLLIKYFDRLHNMQTISASNSKFGKN
jgi:(p)ppGpp synthase/HD superfamily hydrolase